MLIGADAVFSHQCLEVGPWNADLECGAAYIPGVALQGFEDKFPLQVRDRLLAKLFLQTDKLAVCLRNRAVSPLIPGG